MCNVGPGNEMQAVLSRAGQGRAAQGRVKGKVDRAGQVADIQ